MTFCALKSFLVLIAVVIMADARYRVYEDSYVSYFTDRGMLPKRTAGYYGTEDCGLQNTKSDDCTVRLPGYVPLNNNSSVNPKPISPEVIKQNAQKIKETLKKRNILLDLYQTINERRRSDDRDTTSQRVRYSNLEPSIQKSNVVSSNNRFPYNCKCTVLESDD